MIRRALLAAALFGLGCAPTRFAVGAESPISRPPEAGGSPDEAFGHQAIVRTRSQIFHGELVACNDASLFIYLNVSPSPYAVVPWSDVERGEILRPGAAKAGLITWVALGGISTLSHGFWAALTGIPWAAVGAGSIVWGIKVESLAGKCDDLRPYARYPQGLPPVIRERFEKSLTGPPPPEGVPFPGVPLPLEGEAPNAPAPNAAP